MNPIAPTASLFFRIADAYPENEVCIQSAHVQLLRLDIATIACHLESASDGGVRLNKYKVPWVRRSLRFDCLYHPKRSWVAHHFGQPSCSGSALGAEGFAIRNVSPSFAGWFGHRILASQ